MRLIEARSTRIAADSRGTSLSRRRCPHFGKASYVFLIKAPCLSKRKHKQRDDSMAENGETSDNSSVKSENGIDEESENDFDDSDDYNSGTVPIIAEF
eukprot:5973505-Ditylum_brightwellii.AAC.1